MIIRGGFSHFYLTTMLPQLNSVVVNQYKQYPSQIKRVFRVEKSARSIEQFSEISGVGLFRSIGEGEAVKPDTPVQGFPKTFTHTRFGLAIQTSQDAVEDDKIGLVMKTHADLARSMQETREIDAASTFNNAFSGSYLGPDGKSLCATDHPLVKSGGVQSNKAAISADLDVVALQYGLTDFETMLDSAGRKINVPAKSLLVAPQYRWVAFEITKSGMRPDTANNAINAFKYAKDGMPEPMVWPYLDDPDAWFLCASPEDTGLIWFDRRMPYTKIWLDDPTETGNYALRYKKAHGWYQFRGIWGNPGA
jgi:hypothetical protein